MSQDANDTKRQASPCIVNDAFRVHSRRREARASGQASGEKQTTAASDGGHDVISEAIACTKKAGELRDVAIKQLLERRARIESDLKMLGYVPVPVNGNANGTKASAHWKTEKRFRGLTLAQVGKILLSEHEKLHGREIELLAKAGGFKGAANHFQVYLPVAFKRDGGLENIGGNTWKLKEDPA